MTIADRLFRLRHWIAAILFLLFAYSLTGFVIAPWYLQKTSIEVVREQFDAELRIESVRMNPFVLSLTVDGVALDDPDGDEVATVETLFVNFQLSSLFRWAWTFAEVRIDAPSAHISRDPAGRLNVAFLFEQPETPAPDAGETSAGLPRLLIYDFAVNDSRLEWDDRQPLEPVSTQFGPVNVEIVELNTLPRRSGEQAVVITTENNGTLSWTGNLQLNPLASAGKAAITGPHFALPSEYLRPVTGFSIPQGQSDISFAYELHLDDAGVLHAAVEDFDLEFTEVRLRKSDPGTTATGDEDREVLAVPRLTLSDASIAWPERTVHVPTLEVEAPVVNVYRDAEERINWLPDDTPSGTPAEEPAPSPDEPAWQVQVDRVAVQGLVFGFEDHSVDPYADIGLQSMDLLVTDINNREGTRFPLESSMQTRGGGTIRVAGEVQVLPSVDLEWHLAAEDLALALLHPYIKPLADVNLDSGKAGFDVVLKSNDENPALVTGDAFVTDFLITETDQGSELGAWKRLDAKKFALNMADETLDVAEIVFDGAYADILIAEDRTVNLGRVEKGVQTAPDDDDGDGDGAGPPAEAPPDADAAASEPEMQIRIGRVQFENSGADFADESLPLPFSAKIAGLAGTISTIASGSSEASTVELEGTVDEHGFVRVSGSVTPLEPALNTDMRVRFQNVEMPKFSAYSVPFAGRKIAAGRLDLDLGYQVRQRQLVGENNIVLHDFELGEKVDHPGAMSLPLGLAVALLKDSSGTIDIDLPVRGDLDDPEFKYGGLVWLALKNLIVKIVASPFALLGNLIGVEADEISHVDFIAGRADLTPPEQERVGKLVEALGLRPQLVLELPGTVNREVDGLALRHAKVSARIEQELAAEGGDDDADFAEHRRTVLETLVTASGALADPATELEALRLEFTTTPVDDKGKAGKPLLDTVAYTAALEQRLIEIETVSDEELAALGNERAANVRAAIVGAEPGLETRVVVAGKPRVTEEGDETAVPMEITLTAAGAGDDESAGAEPPAD